MKAPDALPDQQALHDALARLLAPLAALAVARGVPYAAIDEMLRVAFIGVASAAHAALPEHRRVSRISAATGLHRREVTRLMQTRAEGAPRAVSPRSLASAVFAHWRADKRYRTRGGTPRTLPRTGPAPSFEALAHEVTRDVHPRTLLEELLRLKLAALDPQTDSVTLLEDAFVPRGDAARMVGFLGANVGDHLQAAVDNVLGDGQRHFEQAIFADGLSAASIEALRPLLTAHWHRMTEELVPVLEKMIEHDDRKPASANRRVRLGLYGFDTTTALAAGADSAPPAAPPPSPRAAAKRRKGPA